ncbi:alpha/beta hydrolase [Nonomuraea sp. 3-1Str]|uniref:alpha/beta hydrolase n=1 Tax=Nonomuraea sp. 3-1Str TaxID=2929801 RepID=UPI002866BF82|nr:alpha/beta hydrolase [Nonomuraea sp. 3-1Str]MDR8411319.1 alpha/beta hydrolase [Nonomuraea sp. 3-1Str]
MSHTPEPKSAAMPQVRIDGSQLTTEQGQAIAGTTRPADGTGPMRRRPILRGSLAVAAGLVTLTASAWFTPGPGAFASTPTAAPSASASPTAPPIATPHLPAPTGPHRVGTTSLHLKDTSRPDPWVPEAKARELMVSLWYPTKARGGQRAPYMTAKESELNLKGSRITGVPADILSKTRTNSLTGAEPAGGRRSLPLVVLSPGFTRPRSSLTGLAEDLASRGYVVAGIDHTYENYATTFPDGRVVTCAACELDTAENIGQKVVENRPADISFVVDQLTGPHARWKGSALIDTSRIAMAGASVGGASATGTMLKDSRIRAGINLDGNMFVPVPASGLARPFMFMGHPAHRQPQHPPRLRFGHCAAGSPAPATDSGSGSATAAGAHSSAGLEHGDGSPGTCPSGLAKGPV